MAEFSLEIDPGSHPPSPCCECGVLSFKPYAPAVALIGTTIGLGHLLPYGSRTCQTQLRGLDGSLPYLSYVDGMSVPCQAFCSSS